MSTQAARITMSSNSPNTNPERLDNYLGGDESLKELLVTGKNTDRKGKTKKFVKGWEETWNEALKKDE
jgi:hypothetical protein